MDIFTNIGLWVGGVVVSAGGWLVKMIFGKFKEHENKYDALRNKFEEHYSDLHRQFEDHRLHVAQNYTPRVYIENMENRLVSHLIRIEAKPDNKEDKK